MNESIGKELNKFMRKIMVNYWHIQNLHFSLCNTSSSKDTAIRNKDLLVSMKK